MATNLTSFPATSSYVAESTKVMNNISTEVKSAAEAFDEITSSSAELSQGGREILKAMQVLQDTSVSVRDGSDQIAQEQHAVREEIEHVGEVVSAIEQAILEVGQAIESIRGSMDHLQGTIAGSREESTRLHKSIGELAEGMK